MTAELWSARRIAKEFGYIDPNSARKWLSRLAAEGKPIRPVDVTLENGRYVPVYDSAAVLRAKEVQPGRGWRGRQAVSR